MIHELDEPKYFHYNSPNNNTGWSRSKRNFLMLG